MCWPIHRFANLTAARPPDFHRAGHAAVCDLERLCIRTPRGGLRHHSSFARWSCSGWFREQPVLPDGSQAPSNAALVRYCGEWDTGTRAVSLQRHRDPRDFQRNLNAMLPRARRDAYIWTMAASYTHIEVRPMAGALGADVHGMDLARPLADATFAE